MPAGYEEFRTALDDYRGAVFDFSAAHAAAVYQLVSLRCNATPVDPMAVDLITARFGLVGSPALERADKAWRRLTSAQEQAFAGDPGAAAVGTNISALKRVIEDLHRSRMLLESTEDLWVACNSDETYQSAVAATESAQDVEIDATQESMRLTGAIQVAFQATQDACKTVRVRGEIPDKQMKKAGDPKTTSTGGASLTYPKSLDVGKKPKKLPVNVKSPQSSYGTVSLKRGSKGIVATGGWFEPGTSGLLMTVPGKTKTGKVTLTFALEGGPTVKAKITLK